MAEGDGNGARITIRLPHRLREALRRLARRDRRSLNAYLVVALERLVRDEGGEGDS